MYFDYFGGGGICLGGFWFGVFGFILCYLGFLVFFILEIFVLGRDVDMLFCEVVEVIKMGNIERLDL